MLWRISWQERGAWGYGKKYYWEASRDYQLRIAALKPIKIDFKGLDPRCKFAPVDGVHVCTKEFRCHPSSKWFSHKFNDPGVGFEVMCNPTNKGGILWATRGLPAAVGDFTKFWGGNTTPSRKTGRKTLFITNFRLEWNVLVIVRMCWPTRQSCSCLWSTLTSYKKDVCNNEFSARDMLQKIQAL